MSLADELLADLDDVGDDEETVEENVQSDKTLQKRAEDSDTEMANEEEVGGGLVLEGASIRDLGGAWKTDYF
jgi:hypothetical protein